MTEQSNSKASLYRKIADVAAHVPIVKPTGYNPDVKKAYADVDDIAGALKPLMEARQLSITMHINQVQRADTGETTKYGSAYVLTTLECTFVIADGETGEVALFPWVAEASDHMKDKGLPKALTIARRTFLLHTFHVIAGDEKQLWSGDQGASYDDRAAQKQQPQKAPVKAPEKPAAAKLPDGPIAAAPKRIAALKTLWEREKDIGIETPPTDLAIDLDNPEEATVDRVNELGKAAAARIKRFETEAELLV